MKKLYYSLLSLAFLTPALSSAAVDSTAVIGKAKDLQSAISACAGKKGGDSCFTSPISKDGRYAAMIALQGACILGKVDFEEEGIQASVLTCQPKKTPVSGTEVGAPKVIKSDASGTTVKVNPPAEIYNK